METFQQTRKSPRWRCGNWQDETGGFLAFIPLSYHPENNVLKVEDGPSAVDELRTYAISRLTCSTTFRNIKAYWTACSIAVAQIALAYGASDFDGTVLQEKIYHMAGATTPQALTAGDLRRLITEAGLWRTRGARPFILADLATAGPAGLARDCIIKPA